MYMNMTIYIVVHINFMNMHNIMYIAIKRRLRSEEQRENLRIQLGFD